MMTVLLILLAALSPRQARALDQCSDPPTIQCAGPSCTVVESCVDAQGCEHSRVIYQQDCTPTPRPNYCPPGNNPAPIFLLRDRKTCPQPPG